MKITKTTSKLASSALMICMLSASAMAQTNANNYVINGTIKDVSPMPAKVYMYLNNSRTNIDSTDVVNGTYHFTGTIDDIVSAQLTPVKFSKAGSYDMASIFLDKGTLNIVSTGSLRNAEVSGSGSAADRDYKEATKNTRRMADSLVAISKTDAFKTDAKLITSVQIAASNLVTPMTAEMLTFVKKNPQSPIAPDLMNTLASWPKISANVIDSLLSTLPPESQLKAKKKMAAELEKKRAAELAKLESEKKTSIGTAAPNFTLNDTKGKPVSLSSFKGKYVLIDFWASWCGPCRGENPNVVKAYNTYKAKGFTILGVSLDGTSTKAAWIAAIQKDGLTWTHVSDLKGFNNEAAKLYGVTAIPQNFLIDPKGNIVAKNLRGEELDKELASLFN